MFQSFCSGAYAVLLTNWTRHHGRRWETKKSAIESERNKEQEVNASPSEVARNVSCLLFKLCTNKFACSKAVKDELLRVKVLMKAGRCERRWWTRRDSRQRLPIESESGFRCLEAKNLWRSCLVMKKFVSTNRKDIDNISFYQGASLRRVQKQKLGLKTWRSFYATVISTVAGLFLTADFFSTSSISFPAVIVWVLI